ncbi:tRNA lysidine(34) synthetase TilS [Algoriphagus halophytocola]|uniref:tRNA(Ile)-lysidine synthase n=1 Tax=Algoriphagus halophytocola TaxID=2991499 RepID=A0ABY6MIR0_9BACT|nr:MULTISPECIES: tRNA lysidine(34) synthetase TilS [unclassified Algoriphagus]UZD22166.1 tRNA lysidine(34) synthetase TilS [Algoriphagus sp. TR-M5]WBL43417.1 tRNA lysidine(34) synthetase TilS [Algoriphagus sp. TR-M9]
MVDTFIRHIRNKIKLDTQARYLLACSGGLDSMVLAHLLLAAEINFEIAHVNFQLRGNESEEDEAFIRHWGNTKGIEIHVHKPATKAYAQDQQVSTQMAARALRYAWFEELRKARNLQGILLAHHQDDQIETIFLNLLRGTGIEGIYGMAERRNWLIRPLLPFSRQEIAAYAKTEEISWREDSTNAQTDYKRNKLRHISLPALYEVAEDSKANLLTSFSRLKDTGRAFSALFDNWVKDNIKEEDGGISRLDLNSIRLVSGAASLLYFWLRPFGFNSDQAHEIHSHCISPQSGKLFGSTTHLLNLDRESLILAPKPRPFSSVIISTDAIELNLPEAQYELLKIDRTDQVDRTKQNAMLDLDQLQFPLEVRTWQEGDRFVPLGMKQEKKISDFLIDLKVPVVLKPGVKVLLSEGRIAWVIGFRIADWAKSTAATRKLLYFKKR